MVTTQWVVIQVDQHIIWLRKFVHAKENSNGHSRGRTDLYACTYVHIMLLQNVYSGMHLVMELTT